MKLLTLAWTIVAASALAAGEVFAYDCNGLPEWKRQHYYLLGEQVQHVDAAYENTADSSKRDRPDKGDPWMAWRASSTPTIT